MIRHNYQLDATIQKVREWTPLWKTERGVIEVGDDTLAILIKMNSHNIGCVFHGDGKLIMDTIVETDRGAIGRPVERKIEKPFIMIGNVDSIRQNLIAANKQDIAKRGYVEEREFIEKAEALCRRFFGEDKGYACGTFEQGFVFAFPSEASGLDMLVAKDSKIVYKAHGMMFVSNEDRVVLKTSWKTVVSNGEKSVVLSK